MFRRLLAAIVAIIVILGFAWLYGLGIYQCLADDTLPTFSPQYVYVATTLAGLVGGVVAMVFNEKLPDAPAPQGALAPVATPSASGMVASLTAIKTLFSFDGSDILRFITAIYAIIYFVIGIAAIATWLKINETPDLIKNLALISIGLFVAIARSFFNVPPPKGS